MKIDQLKKILDVYISGKAGELYELKGNEITAEIVERTSNLNALINDATNLYKKVEATVTVSTMDDYFTKEECNRFVVTASHLKERTLRILNLSEGQALALIAEEEPTEKVSDKDLIEVQKIAGLVKVTSLVRGCSFSESINLIRLKAEEKGVGEVVELLSSERDLILTLANN